MEKIHIVRWENGKIVKGVYKDYEEAERVAKDLNSKRPWFHKIFADSEYAVKTFSVK